MKLALAKTGEKTLVAVISRAWLTFSGIDPCTRVQFKKARKCGKYSTSETAWQACLNGLVGSGRAHVFQDG